MREGEGWTASLGVRKGEYNERRGRRIRGRKVGEGWTRSREDGETGAAESDQRWDGVKEK